MLGNKGLDLDVLLVCFHKTFRLNTKATTNFPFNEHVTEMHKVNFTTQR